MNINVSRTNISSFANSSARGISTGKISNRRSGASGKVLRDMNVKGASASSTTGLYSKPSNKKYISQLLLNFMNSDISRVEKRGNLYYCDGVSFTANQIPKINISDLNEIKADNNVLNFGKENYFKYIANSGKEYCLYAGKGSIGTVFSEYLRGEPYDLTREKYAGFWNYIMQDDPVYIGLSYSDKEIREYLDEAGIKNGFFTIKMGDRCATHFYSASESRGPIHSKQRYDIRYSSLVNDGYLLNLYEPGSIFKVDGKEYTLSENHTLDIPYGEDIYKLEYPSNYRYGKKID